MTDNTKRQLIFGFIGFLIWKFFFDQGTSKEGFDFFQSISAGSFSAIIGGILYVLYHFFFPIKVPVVSSQSMGDFTEMEEFPNWWVSKQIQIEFLGKRKVEIVFMDHNPKKDDYFIEEAEDLFEKLNQDKQAIEKRAGDALFEKYGLHLPADNIELDELFFKYDENDKINLVLPLMFLNSDQKPLKVFLDKNGEVVKISEENL